MAFLNEWIESLNIYCGGLLLHAKQYWHLFDPSDRISCSSEFDFVSIFVASRDFTWELKLSELESFDLSSSDSTYYIGLRSWGSIYSEIWESESSDELWSSSIWTLILGLIVAYLFKLFNLNVCFGFVLE